MNPIDLLQSIVIVYLAGAIIVGGFYVLVLLAARNRGTHVSNSPLVDIAITAILWPAFIAFMINKTFLTK